MSASRPIPVDQPTYWNEEGGQRWVSGMERIEAMLAPLSDELLAVAAPAPGEQVLDVGCGGGVTSAACAVRVGAGGSVLGADVSRVILDVARRRYAAVANLDFVAADASTHPFAAGRFDLVTSRFGVMFFHDPVAAFTNLRRATRGGGRLVFMCWRTLDENPWMGVAARAAFTVLTPPPKAPPGTPGPFSFADPDHVQGILGAAGYTSVTFSRHDCTIRLGSPDEATAWLTEMGPAAFAMREAPAHIAAAARAAIQDALVARAEASQVNLAGAVWLVRAHA